MRSFFGEIIQYLARHPGEANYGERIVRYLEDHYREEIAFEDMAKEIGISYSYMRKVAYELTGSSLIDCVNKLRIEKAKQLLLDCNLSISRIAAEVEATTRPCSPLGARSFCWIRAVRTFRKLSVCIHIRLNFGRHS